VTFTGANTFAGLACRGGSKSLVFPSSTTTTIANGGWNVSGTSGNLVTITASTSGTAATLKILNGIVSSDYLSLKDSTATGGAQFFAGSHSTNVSNVTGWTFSAPPAAVQAPIYMVV
jgi:hypothetical protein